MSKTLPHRVVEWDGGLASALLLGDRVTWAKGTHFRQENLLGVLRGKQSIKMAIATLVREPANAHDSNAIAVMMGDSEVLHVGYLDRAIAAEIAEQIDALGSSVSGAPTCLASVYKTGAHGDRAYTVKLLGPWPIKLSSDMSRDESLVTELDRNLKNAIGGFEAAVQTSEQSVATTQTLLSERQAILGERSSLVAEIQHLRGALHVANTTPRKSSLGGAAIALIVIGGLFAGCFGLGAGVAAIAPAKPAPSSTVNLTPPPEVFGEVPTAPIHDAGRDARAAKK